MRDNYSTFKFSKINITSDYDFSYGLEDKFNTRSNSQ